MASRHCGLKFGRFPFEFGISGSAGSDHSSREPPFPIWRGTTAHLERYYRCWVAVLPLDAQFHLFLPSFDPCCFVWWLMLFPSCVSSARVFWFQVMIILSSRSAVSTPVVQRQSATALLSQQVVPLVLNHRQQAQPQVLHHHLSSRRDPPTSQRERL